MTCMAFMRNAEWVVHCLCNGSILTSVALKNQPLGAGRISGAEKNQIRDGGKSSELALQWERERETDGNWDLNGHKCI